MLISSGISSEFHITTEHLPHSINETAYLLSISVSVILLIFWMQQSEDMISF